MAGSPGAATARARRRDPGYFISRPVTYITSMPAATPAKVSNGDGSRASSPADQPADLPGDLEDRAGADAEEERRQRQRVGEAADPGADDRRRAGEQARAAARRCQRRPVAQHRRDDAEPLGDVLDDEADHQEGAERDLAEGVGRPDREPLAEVVQADRRARSSSPAPAAGSPRRARRLPGGWLTASSRRNVSTMPRPTRRDALERARRPARPAPAPRRSRRCPGRPAARRSAPSGRSRRGGRVARSAGHQSRPRKTGITPTYRPISVNESSSVRRSASASRTRPGSRPGSGSRRDGDDHDLVRLGLDPAVGDVDRRAVEPVQRRARVDHRRPDRVVDDHLRDRQLLRPDVAHVQVEALRR